MDGIGMRIFCGLPPIFGRQGLRQIAARRFDKIKGTLPQLRGDYLYGGLRCSTMGVSNRFATEAFRSKKKLEPYHEEWKGIRGWFRYKWACLTTWLGLQDGKIEMTYHERASAEWWYTYEKDWD